MTVNSNPGGRFVYGAGAPGPGGTPMGPPSPRGVPWPIIIIALVLFFPVGIPLMLWTLHREKDRCAVNGKRTAIVGWVFFGIGIIYLISALTGNLEVTDESSVVSGVILMLLIFCGGGYLLVHHGNRYRKLGADYAAYSAILSGSANGSLDEVASIRSKSYEQVCGDLQRLVKSGFFPGAYLDQGRRAFVSPELSGRPASGHAGASHAPQGDAAASPKVVVCPNCGGRNTVAGGRTECEYCGSPLS